MSGEREPLIRGGRDPNSTVPKYPSALNAESTDIAYHAGHSPSPTYGGSPVMDTRIETRGRASSMSNTNGKGSSHGHMAEGGEGDKNEWGLFDRRRRILLSFLCLSGMLAALSVSILTPFFPREAAKKHLSESESGYIFSVFAVIEFFFCPLWGFLIPHVGVRFMYTASTFFSSASTFMFGILDEIPADSDNGWRFMIMCMVVRSAESVGIAAYLTAVFATIASEFQDGVTTAFSLVETFHGVGFVLGPPLGGILYQFGGYKLPFMVLGGCLFLTSIANCMFVPITSGNVAQIQTASPLAMFKLLKFPVIILVCILVTWCAFIGGCIQPTFEPYLRENFQMDPMYVGFVFFAYAFTLTIFTPIYGFICQKVPGFLLIIMGCIGMSIGISMLSPSLFLFPEGTTILWLLILGLSLCGVFAAAINVPTMELWINAAVIGGWANDVVLHGVISGMWSAFDALGTFIGPIFGANMVEYFGFQHFFTYLALVPGSLGILMIIYALLTCGMPIRLRQMAMEKQEEDAAREAAAAASAAEAESEEEGKYGVPSIMVRQASGTPYLPPISETDTEPQGDELRINVEGRAHTAPVSPASGSISPRQKRKTGGIGGAGPAEEDLLGEQRDVLRDTKAMASYRKQLEKRYLLAQPMGMRASASHIFFARPSIADATVHAKMAVARRKSQQIGGTGRLAGYQGTAGDLAGAGGDTPTPKSRTMGPNPRRLMSVPAMPPGGMRPTS